jgi:hypothetical protein
MFNIIGCPGAPHCILFYAENLPLLLVGYSADAVPDRNKKLHHTVDELFWITVPPQAQSCLIGYALDYRLGAPHWILLYAENRPGCSLWDTA